MHRSVTKAWHLVAAVFAVLLAHAYLAPTASASCGDYVTIEPHGAMPTEPSEPPRSGPDDRPPCPCEHRPLEPGHVPCQGPWCSGSPTPITAPVMTPDQVHDSWACWWAAFVLGDGASSHHRVVSAPADGVERAEPIFHPPRTL